MANGADIGFRVLHPVWSTIQGTVRTRTDLERTRRALERDQPEHGSAGMVVAGIGGSGAEDPVVPSTMDLVQDVWLDRVGRFRIETNGAALVGDRDVVTHGHDPRWAVRSPNEDTARVWLVDPGFDLFGMMEIEPDHPGEHLGRPVVFAHARLRESAERVRRRFGPLMGRTVVTSTASVVFDAETGIVLRYVALDDDGAPIETREFTQIVVDEPIEAERFTFTLRPGQRVVTPNEMWLEHLAETGVDVTGIDPDDQRAVRAAMASARPGGGGGAPFPRRPRREVVAPLGPPPEDEDAARAAVEEAISRYGDTDEIGTHAWIERGELLTDAFVAARSRHQQMGERGTTFRCEEVVFVHDDEALVSYAIEIPGMIQLAGQRGRVVRRGDRWLVSYDTAAAVFEQAGVRVPSLDDTDT